MQKRTLYLLVSQAYSAIARRCREREKDCKKPLSIPLELMEFGPTLETIWVEDLKNRHAKIVDEIIRNKGELARNGVVAIEVAK
ncbi:MAG: hypothetical protein QXG08_04595 [Candidatus Methanomethyliaceae archaeon]